MGWKLMLKSAEWSVWMWGEQEKGSDEIRRVVIMFDILGKGGVTDSDKYRVIA